MIFYMKIFLMFGLKKIVVNGLDLMCSTLQVRRLRVQQRLKNLKPNENSSEDNEMPDIPSSIPFLPSVVNYSFLMCI